MGPGSTSTYSSPWSFTYLAGVVDDAEVGLVLELARLLELGVRALLLEHLVYEGLVCGLGEPTLLIQQGQHSWGVGLHTHTQMRKQNMNVEVSGV